MKQAIEQNRVFYGGGKNLLLNFSLANAGTRVWAWNDRMNRLRLSIRNQAPNSSAVALTVRKRGTSGKALNVTSLLKSKGEGYYTIYSETKNSTTDFIVIKDDESKVEKRVKTSYSRNVNRVTSYGRAVLSQFTRAAYNAMRESSLSGLIRVQYDCKNSYACRFSPYDPILDKDVLSKEDFMKMYGKNALKKLGVCSFYFPASQKSSIMLLPALIELSYTLECLPYGKYDSFHLFLYDRSLVHTSGL